MGSITILDGGMGKYLRRIGAPFQQPEWSALALMEAPEFVVQAHTGFIEAGAQIIITNNYAVVPYHLGDDLVAARGHELTALAGQLAREAACAASHDVQVAGSLPPLFGSYEPENFDPDRAPAYYRQMVEALDPYVDLWVAETLSSAAEAHVIAEAVESSGTGDKPLWLSFALPDHWVEDMITLRSGENIGDVADTASDHREVVDAVLFNCSLPEQIGPALAELSVALDAAQLDVRIGGYANGFPDARDNDPSYAANATLFERRGDLDAHGYADVVGTWIDTGATIVGGCCDMYPEDIAALAQRFG